MTTRDESVQVPQRLRVPAAARGGEAGQIRGQLTIPADEIGNLVLRQLGQPLPSYRREPRGKLAPPLAALRDERVLLARRTGVAPRRRAAGARIPLADVQLREKGAIRRDRRRYPRTELRRQLPLELVGALGVERRPALLIAIEQRKLVIGQLRRRGHRGRTGGRRGNRGHPLRDRALADHDRPRRIIAESLPAR